MSSEPLTPTAMNEKTPICPICEQSHLEAATHTGNLDHSGQTLEVPGLEFWQCSSCGADPVYPDQARRNHRRFQDARRKADGLLTGAEIASIRRRHGLTQSEAAKIFGGGTNAFSKYERGDVIQSVAMDRLLRLASADAAALRRLQQLAGVENAQTRISSPAIGLHAGTND